ncbi:MAG: hypothetical protein Q7V88_18315 [Actinomycetota bacterium]|nr:hypothetical protein [Actinomycetota bacterium]
MAATPSGAGVAGVAGLSGLLGRRWAPWACWGVVALVVLVLLDREGAPTTFFYDEWGFVQHRRGWSPNGFVQPHAGHLVAIPVLIYRVGFELFGLTHYRPFRVMVLLSHLAVATAVFAYVKQRTHVLLAGCAGLAIAMLGSGWQNIYFPFSVSHTLPVALGIAAWMLLDRDTRRADHLAAGAHLVAVLSSGLGISMLIGSGVKLAVQREWGRAVRVLSPAAAAFVIWQLAYGKPAGTVDNLPRMPRYMVDMVAGGAGGLFARDLLWGRLLLGVLVGLAAMRWRVLLPAAAPLGCLLGDVLLVAYNRAQFGDPTASRYAYEMAVLLLLVLAAATAGRPLRRGALPAGLVLCALSIWGNWALLHRGALGLRIDSTISAHELRAVEWAAGVVAPEFEPDHQRMPFLYAGTYLAAVHELGSPATTDAAVLAAPEATRQLVDQVSLGALGVFTEGFPTAVEPGDDCSAVDSGDEAVVQAGEVLWVRAGTAPVEVRARRLADGYVAAPAHIVDAGAGFALSVPVDGAPTQTWSVQLTSAAAVLVCR